MKRQYMIGKDRPNSTWFYGYVRFRRWHGWSKWFPCCEGAQDRKVIERMIDKYEAEQPDSYRYLPKAFP